MDDVSRNNIKVSQPLKTKNKKRNRPIHRPSLILFVSSRPRMIYILFYTICIIWDRMWNYNNIRCTYLLQNHYTPHSCFTICNLKRHLAKRTRFNNARDLNLLFQKTWVKNSGPKSTTCGTRSVRTSRTREICRRTWRNISKNSNWKASRRTWCRRKSNAYRYRVIFLLSFHLLALDPRF